MLWNGLNNQGAAVPVGVYRAEIVSQHSYEGGDIVSWIAVDDPSSGLEITDIQAKAYGARIAVKWNTNIPTYGCVDYKQDDSEIACVRSADSLLRMHLVWLPDVITDATYQYYIKAWDDAGHVNLSGEREITAGDWPCIFEVKSHFDSSTQRSASPKLREETSDSQESCRLAC